MSRRPHAIAVWVVASGALLSLAAQSSCSGESAAAKRAGEPCTRTSECESDLVCGGGVCRSPNDASSDASADH